VYTIFNLKFDEENRWFFRIFTAQKGDIPMFIVLGGGLLIIIIAVIVAVVSSVVSAVAADQDVED